MKTACIPYIRNLSLMHRLFLCLKLIGNDKLSNSDYELYVSPDSWKVFLKRVAYLCKEWIPLTFIAVVLNPFPLPVSGLGKVRWYTYVKKTKTNINPFIYPRCRKLINWCIYITKMHKTMKRVGVLTKERVEWKRQLGSVLPWLWLFRERSL